MQRKLYISLGISVVLATWLACYNTMSGVFIEESPSMLAAYLLYVFIFCLMFPLIGMVAIKGQIAAVRAIIDSHKKKMSIYPTIEAMRDAMFNALKESFSIDRKYLLALLISLLTYSVVVAICYHYAPVAV